jgi:hypothetical protein
MPISYIETASLDTALNAPTATALSTASGSAPSYSARAWVNFNGTGTVAIRSSGNVTSITDGGVGLYTVNLTTAMPDTNYVVLKTDNNFDVGGSEPTNSSSALIVCRNSSFVLADASVVSVSILR